MIFKNHIFLIKFQYKEDDTEDYVFLDSTTIGYCKYDSFRYESLPDEIYKMRKCNFDDIANW